MFHLLIPVLLVLSLLACRPTAPDTRRLHLIVDAGSSGTRFCLFEVAAGAAGKPLCQAKTLASPFDECRSIEARDGLANLNAAEINTTLASGFATIPAELAREIDGIVVLGTGGFRRQAPAASAAQAALIRDFFKQKGLAARVEIISGETEGALAWQTARQVFASDRHAILETGGATVQFAAGAAERVVSLSLPLGMTETFVRLKDLPAFRACYAVPGTDRSQINFAVCSGLIGSTVFASSGLTQFAAKNAGLPAPRLFALGSPWEAVFQMAGKNALTRDELKTLGTQFCAKTPEQLVAAGIPEKHTARTCFLWSYQAALFDSTGLPRIEAGNESWPRGAAASDLFFPTCAVDGGKALRGSP